MYVLRDRAVADTAEGAATRKAFQPLCLPVFLDCLAMLPVYSVIQGGYGDTAG